MARHYFNKRIVDINGRGNVNKYSAKRIFWGSGTNKRLFNSNIYGYIINVDV